MTITGASEIIPGQFRDKGGAVFNVKHPDFGATGDGATDDTAALQLAVAAVIANGGGTLYAPKGTYILNPDAGLVHITSNVHLVGEGEGVTTFKRKTGATSTDGGFYFGDNTTQQSNIAVRNLTLDGNKASGTPAGTGVVLFSKNITGLVYENVEIKNGGFFGHNAINCLDVTTNNIHSHDNNRDGYSWSEGHARFAHTNITTHDNGDDGFALNEQGAAFAAGSGTVTTADRVATFSSAQSFLVGATVRIASKNYIVVVKTSTTVMTLNDAPIASAAAFTYAQGLTVYDGVVSNVTSYNNGTAALGASGFKISGDVRHVKISGVVCDLSAGAGLSVIASSNTRSPTDIEIDGSFYRSGQYAGAANKQNALISGAASHITLRACVADGLAEGLQIDSGSSGIHLDVVSERNAFAGVKLDGSGNRVGRVTGRILARDNGGCGMLAINADRLLLDSLIAIDNNTAGGVATNVASNAYVNDVTTLRIAGGDVGQHNTTLTNKALYGLAFVGTACGDVTVTGLACLGVATVAQRIFLNVIPTGTIRIANCDGFSFSAFDVFRFENGSPYTIHAAAAATPEAALTASIGSTVQRTNGGAERTLYIKTSGTGTTGWLPIVVHALATVTYSASMTPDASLGVVQTITATNNTAFTINAASNSTIGQRLRIRVRNTSGGALGAATWSATYKMGAAWTQPANGFSRAIDFDWDGTNWVEANRSAADIAN